MTDTRPRAGAADYVTLLQRRLLLAVDELRAATAAAYRRGRADGYTEGYLDAVAEHKRTERELVHAMRSRATLWYVRGQRRTRQTFADPHHGDYPGALP